MTQEQISALITLLSNAPTQVLITLILWTLWKFVTVSFSATTLWLRTELSSYMERDRAIVSSHAIAPTVPVASKYGPLTPTAPT